MDTSSAMEEGVLSGLRVIDAGTMIGGPFAGTLAADYGADVIKIERPDGGDPIRQWSPLKDGVSLWWKVTARNKRLVTLDLRKAKGRELFLRLVASADAVIENYRPGTFDRWGLSYDELRGRTRGSSSCECRDTGRRGRTRTGPDTGRSPRR